MLKDKVIDVEIAPFEIDDTLDKVLKLPPKYKIVVYMYYYEGYSTVEIAEILEKNESTIRSHLHLARKRLKMAIESDRKSG